VYDHRPSRQHSTDDKSNKKQRDVSEQNSSTQCPNTLITGGLIGNGFWDGPTKMQFGILPTKVQVHNTRIVEGICRPSGSHHAAADCGWFGGIPCSSGHGNPDREWASSGLKPSDYPLRSSERCSAKHERRVDDCRGKGAENTDRQSNITHAARLPRELIGRVHSIRRISFAPSPRQGPSRHFSYSGTHRPERDFVVGLPGFEPGTSASRTQRANQTAPQPASGRDRRSGQPT
jgi:hypothetical protein